LIRYNCCRPFIAHMARKVPGWICVMVALVSPYVPGHWPAHCSTKEDGPSAASPVKSICTVPLVRMIPVMAGRAIGVPFVFPESEKLSMPKVTRDPEPVAGESAAMRIQTFEDRLLAFVPRL